MKSLTPHALAIPAVLLSAIAGAQPVQPPAGSPDAARATTELEAQKVLETQRRACGADEPAEVSLLQLIATPEKYQGRLVRVIAFLRVEFEGNALYLHQEDYAHAIYKNAIWIDLDHKDLSKNISISDRYVIAEGRFDATLKGHLGMFSGTLTSVCRLDAWR